VGDDLPHAVLPLLAVVPLGLQDGPEAGQCLNGNVSALSLTGISWKSITAGPPGPFTPAENP
jgi:hypothetical protein